MSRNILILITLLITLAWFVAEAKYSKIQFHLNKIVRDDMKYITKFGYENGKGTAQFRAKFSRELREKQNLSYINFWLSIHNTRQWQSIVPDAVCSSKVQNSQVSKEISIPVTGEWSVIQTVDVIQSEEGGMYYFAITNCQDQVPEQQGKNKGIKLEVEMEILNPDGNHFSLEDEYQFINIIVLFIISLAIFVFAIMKFKKENKESDDFNYFFILVVIISGLFCLQLLFDLIHLWVYSQNGHGVSVINLFAQIFGMASQFMLVVLLIMLSQGWTVNFMEIDSFDLTIPLAFLVGLIHLIVIGLGKLSDDSEKKFQTYYSWIGIVLICMRIIAIIIFIVGSIQLVKSARFKVKPFVNKLIIFGTLYLITMPSLVFYSQFLTDYKRFQFVFLGIAYCHLIAICRFIYLCVSKKTDYYNASIRGQSSLPLDGKSE